MERNQYTLKQAVSCEGVGLHSGEPVTMTIRPAEAGTGIVFRRTDLPGHPEIPASPACLSGTNRATTLGRGGARVTTIEHVLSALYALHVDNCVIELDREEPPVGDGSAAVFVGMVREAGLAEQAAPMEVFSLPRSAAAYEDGKFVAALPYEGLRITYTSVNAHPMLGTQMLDVTLTPETYEREIASARTIGFTWELEALRKMGLARGGTTDNAVVYSEEGCLSVPRYPDELVRHKILDILGDISLVGPIHAHIIAFMGSHRLNGMLSEQILAMKSERHGRVNVE